MSDLEHLNQIVNNTFLPDNEAIKRSEAILQTLRNADINQYIFAFTNLLKLTQESRVKVFCLVHIRRYISDFTDSGDDGKWEFLHPDTQKLLKDTLIELLNNDEDPKSRQVLCELIGDLAATVQTLKTERKSKCTQEGAEWANLMQILWGLLNSGNPRLMESALRIMAVLFTHCGQNYASYKDELLPLLGQTLTHQSAGVSASTMQVIACYLENTPFKSCKPFADLMPTLLSQILVVTQQKEDLATTGLAAVQDILDTEPKVVKKSYKLLVEVCATLLKGDILDGIKRSALETLTLSVERLPKTYNKDQQALKEVIEQIFTYMITFDEEPDEEWLCPPQGYVDRNHDENSPDSPVFLGIGLIDRLIEALHKKKTLALLSGIIVEMVKSNNWKYQHCALMTLSQVGEHIDDLNEFDPIVNFIVNFLQSDHPKVRHAALHCIGQNADDCKPAFQEKYGKTLLPTIISMFNDRVPRVVYHALNAITNFLEGCPKELALSCINEILEPCLHFLHNGSSYIQESALTAIGGLAEACETAFIPYWQKTAEAIFSVLNNTTSKELKSLRGEAIEALTVVGEAVGRQEFKKVCNPVIEKMVEIQTSDVDKSDPQCNFLLSGWHRICSVLGEDFIPYLNYIMPSLFKLVEEIIKGDDERRKNIIEGDADNVVASKVVDTKGDDKQGLFYSANTSESDEVAVMARMMRGFATELKSGYIPYVEKTSEILVYLLENSENDDVKAEAAEGLPELIMVITNSNHPDKAEITRKIHNLYIKTLWEVVWSELDPELMGKYVDFMKQVLINGGRCMNEGELNEFNACILKTMKHSEERRSEVNEYYGENAEDEYEEEDEEVVDENNKLEEELHYSLSELIGVLFRIYKEYTLPLVNIIYTDILPKALNPENTPAFNKFGLFLIDDMIEYLGIELIPQQWPHLSEALLKYATHQNIEVRLAAAYGIGELALKSKEGFRGLSNACMTVLYQALDMQKKEGEDAEDFGSAKDNIVAALGKIIKSQHDTINVKEVIKVWVNHLPLRYDLQEGKVQHELLVDIILESDAALIFGESGENLAKVIMVLAKVVDTRAASGEGFKEKVKKVVQLLASNEGTKALLQNAIGGLSRELQAKLQKIVEN